MFVSTILRFVNGVLILLILARCWGPQIFGVFMYPFTLAAVIVILVDYGFNLQLVRDIGKNTRDAHKLTCQAVVIKTILTVIVAAVGLPLIFLLNSLAGYRLILVLLLFSNILNSYGLLFNLSFRGMGLFDKEVQPVFWSSMVTFLLIGGLVLSGNGPAAIAVGFVISKAFFLIHSWTLYKRLIGDASFTYPDWSGALTALKNGFPFAAHVALGTLYFSVDTIIIQHILGAEDVGIYQSGMRIMIGGLILTEVLSNVYLSKMARESCDRNTLISLATSMTRHCLMIGASGYVCMIGFSELAVTIIYGSGYSSVIPLFPLWGIVFLLRYLGASYGILLTVADRQAVRMLAVTLSVFVSITLNFALIPRYDLYGALYASIITHVFLTAIYIVFAWRHVRHWLMEWRSWTLMSLAFLAGMLQMFTPPDDLTRYTVMVAFFFLICLIGLTSTEYSNFFKRMHQYASNLA